MNKGHQGWIRDEKAVDAVMDNLPYPVFSDVWSPIKGSGKGKTVLLYDIIRKVNGGKFPNRKQTVGDCLAKDSLVVGPDDIKKIQDVKVGDRVYAGNGEITNVVSTMCKKSYNAMVKIHTVGGIPLEVTSDHKVLTYQFGKFVNDNTKWRRRYSPGAANKSGGGEVATTFATREATLVKAGDLTESDYILCPLDIKFDTKIPDEMLPYMGDKESRWMIGLFLGDGHAKKSSKTLEWGCTSDEPEIECRLCGALDDLNISHRVYFHCPKNSKKAKKVYTHKVEKMYNLFRRYFYDEGGYKVLPSWAINDDVIQGLLDSDGHTSKDGQTQCFDSTSPSLVYGLRLWALTKGYIPSLNKRQRFDKRTNKTNKISYSVKWRLDKCSRRIWRDEQYLAMPITKIEAKEGPHEEVYDIGVQHQLHTFLDGSGAAISNCVSQGAAYAVDAVKAVDIYIKKDFESWVAETATEDIYAGSRIQIGGGRINGDGSVGAWAAKYINQYGALPRKKYGKVDLTTYSGDRARSWGRRGKGAPSSIVKIAKEHPIEVVSRVDTYEQCRDLITNGYAVTIASMQGFSSLRDSEGFAKPKGNWAHQMCILGVDDAYKRPGVLVQNSWGAWNGGPKRLNQPTGSFWVDADEIEKRILRQKDSWAFSSYVGFEPQTINTRII
jgi:intein/homing endonuclease